MIKYKKRRRLFANFGEFNKISSQTQKRVYEKYGFEENVDFLVVWNDPKTGDVVEFNGNTNQMVKMDMAKELAMVENNERIN